VAAFGLRVGWIAETSDHRLCCDASDYDRLATSLAQGDGFPEFGLSEAGGPTAFRPPLYPLLIGGAYAVTGTAESDDRVTVARVTGALLGTLTVALIGLLALSLGLGRRTATVAMGLAACYPPLILYGTSLLSEPLFLPLELGALLAALRYRADPDAPRAWGWLAAAGALGGLCALTRPNGLLVPLAIALALIVVRPRPGRAALRGAAVFAVAAALTVLPWVIRNQVEMGTPTLTTSTGFALAGTYNEQAAEAGEYPASWILPPQMPRLLAERPSETEFDRELREDAIDYLTAHPAYVLEVAWHNSLRLLDLDAGFTAFVLSLDPGAESLPADLARYAFYGVLALALLAALTGGLRRVPSLVWWTIGLFTLSSVLVWGANRYRQPVEPFLIVFAALPLTRAFEAVAAAVRRPEPTA
jgi:hypothetical protein